MVLSERVLMCLFGMSQAYMALMSSGKTRKSFCLLALVWLILAITDTAAALSVSMINGVEIVVFLVTIVIAWRSLAASNG